MLTPARIISVPETSTAAFGAGTPLDAVYGTMCVTCRKWSKPESAKKPPKRIRPARKMYDTTSLPSSGCALTLPSSNHTPRPRPRLGDMPDYLGRHRIAQAELIPHPAQWLGN